MPYEKYPKQPEHTTDEDYLESLEPHYKSNYDHTRGMVEGISLGLKKQPNIKDKWEATFWHLVTSSENEKIIEEMRTIIHERAERIVWLRKIVDHINGSNFKMWFQYVNNENRLHIAFNDFSYIAIIAVRFNKAQRSFYLLPWTAYPIQFKHQQGKLEKRFNRAVQKNECYTAGDIQAMKKGFLETYV